MADYYVNPESGSNGNPGTEAQPFYATLTFNFETNYNLADWRTTYSFDVNSNTTPYEISKTIYKVNTTTETDSFPLTAIYEDWDSIQYDTGSITLEPNESRLLFYVAELFYDLTLQVDPAGAGNATQNPASPYETATAVTLTATANPSYVFLGWFDGATELSTDNPYIYTTGSENKILTAKFEINLSGPFIKKGKWATKTIT